MIEALIAKFDPRLCVFLDARSMRATEVCEDEMLATKKKSIAATVEGAGVERKGDKPL